VITRLEKVFLNFSILLAALTGLVYAGMKYLIRPSDPFSVVNHPWQPGLLSAHVLVAPLLLFGFGLITREHILGRYRDRRARGGRKTGIVTALVLVPMVGSGYLLQVVKSAEDRSRMGILHLAAGILFLAVYGFHLAFATYTLRSQEGKARNRGARHGPPGAAKPVRRRGDSAQGA
jgi:hypothetical protein